MLRAAPCFAKTMNKQTCSNALRSPRQHALFNVACATHANDNDQHCGADLGRAIACANPRRGNRLPATPSRGPRAARPDLAGQKARIYCANPMPSNKNARDCTSITRFGSRRVCRMPPAKSTLPPAHASDRTSPCAKRKRATATATYLDVCACKNTCETTSCAPPHCSKQRGHSSWRWMVKEARTDTNTTLRTSVVKLLLKPTCADGLAGAGQHSFCVRSRPLQSPWSRDKHVQDETNCKSHNMDISEYVEGITRRKAKTMKMLLGGTKAKAPV